MKRFRFRLEKVLEIREYYDAWPRRSWPPPGKSLWLEHRLEDNARASRTPRGAVFPGRDIFDMQPVDGMRGGGERAGEDSPAWPLRRRTEQAGQGYVEASREAALDNCGASESEYYRRAPGGDEGLGRPGAVGKRLDGDDQGIEV
jgi:hypothetical protein